MTDSAVQRKMANIIHGSIMEACSIRVLNKDSALRLRLRRPWGTVANIGHAASRELQISCAVMSVDCTMGTMVIEHKTRNRPGFASDLQRQSIIIDSADVCLKRIMPSAYIITPVDVAAGRDFAWSVRHLVTDGLSQHMDPVGWGRRQTALRDGTAVTSETAFAAFANQHQDDIAHIVSDQPGTPGSRITTAFRSSLVIPWMHICAHMQLRYMPDKNQTRMHIDAWKIVVKPPPMGNAIDGLNALDQTVSAYAMAQHYVNALRSCVQSMIHDGRMPVDVARSISDSMDADANNVH